MTMQSLVRRIVVELSTQLKQKKCNCNFKIDLTTTEKLITQELQMEFKEENTEPTLGLLQNLCNEAKSLSLTAQRIKTILINILHLEENCVDRQKLNKTIDTLKLKPTLTHEVLIDVCKVEKQRINSPSSWGWNSKTSNTKQFLLSHSDGVLTLH